jgi:hypothetical protein
MGVGAGDATVSGAGTGAVGVSGIGSGDVSVLGAGTALLRVAASGAGAVAVDGSATAAVQVQGAGAGVASITGQAYGDAITLTATVEISAVIGVKLAAGAVRSHAESGMYRRQIEAASRISAHTLNAIWRAA